MADNPMGYLSNVLGNPDRNTIRGPNVRAQDLPPIVAPKPSPFAAFKAQLPPLPSIHRLFGSK